MITAPSSLPSRLTEECYVQKIQPLLKAKKVREVAAAIPSVRVLCRFHSFRQAPPASETLGKPRQIGCRHRDLPRGILGKLRMGQCRILSEQTGPEIAVCLQPQLPKIELLFHPGAKFARKSGPQRIRRHISSQFVEERPFAVLRDPAQHAYLLDWITALPLKREWFFEQRNGNARLMASLTERLAETAPTWGRAVAPVAEWVAQALWSTAGKSTSKEPNLPTRLTQRHRSEGRGNAFVMGKNPLPRPGKICEVCGAEGVKGRSCRSCSVEASRENMAQAALFGHMKPKGKKAKARISKTISDHAVANTWWDPSSLPGWLSENCYIQRIQPQLRTKKVREIAEAVQVSQPYAALIRSGRRRPHMRHWRNLANLVGFKDQTQ